jgi:hypothetical protein
MLVVMHLQQICGVCQGRAGVATVAGFLVVLKVVWVYRRGQA